MLSTVYGLSLSGLAAVPSALKEATGSMVAVSSSGVEDELANQLSLANRSDQQPSASCMVVNRFESHGGGWGYSAYSLEAIQFKVCLSFT
jgi:hypothetical protein